MPLKHPGDGGDNPKRPIETFPDNLKHPQEQAKWVQHGFKI